MTARAGSGLPKKLGIGPGTRVSLVSTPSDFREKLDPLPNAARVVDGARGVNDVLVFFATRSRELERRFPKLANAVRPDGSIWIVWPRQSACIATDLSEKVVRAIGVEQGFLDTRLSSVAEGWAGVRFVFSDPDAVAAQRARA